MIRNDYYMTYDLLTLALPNNKYLVAYEQEVEYYWQTNDY